MTVVSKSPTRRRFLLAAASLGCAATAAGVWKWNTPGHLQRIERSSLALGSRVSIIAYHEDVAHASNAIDHAFAELETIEKVMSIYRPASQVSMLNETGRLEQPQESLVQVLRTAHSVSRATKGAFDITIGPLWNVYFNAKAENRLPTDEEINTAKQYVDYRQVVVSENLIELQSANARISLNGIAQGYALDRVKQTLLQHEIEHVLIDTGEFGGVGSKAASEPWKVGVQDPRFADQLADIVQLDGRCLATSGDYATTFSPDSKHHHLFDPRTGRSPTELASVSVLAATGMLADAYSTALFVLGLKRGLEWISTLQNVDAILITKQGEMITT